VVLVLSRNCRLAWPMNCLLRFAHVPGHDYEHVARSGHRAETSRRTVRRFLTGALNARVPVLCASLR
jgi:hypothetical protein